MQICFWSAKSSFWVVEALIFNILLQHCQIFPTINYIWYKPCYPALNFPWTKPLSFSCLGEFRTTGEIIFFIIMVPRHSSQIWTTLPKLHTPYLHWRACKTRHNQQAWLTNEWKRTTKLQTYTLLHTNIGHNIQITRSVYLRAMITSHIMLVMCFAFRNFMPR